MGALTPNRKTPAMPQAAVTSDLHETLDVLRYFATQISFDFEVLVDIIP
jgi:hypothetical protein